MFLGELTRGRECRYWNLRLNLLASSVECDAFDVTVAMLDEHSKDQCGGVNLAPGN